MRKSEADYKHDNLKQIIDFIRQCDASFLGAFAIGLSCSRAFHEGSRTVQAAQRAAMIDLLRESPLVSLAAFRGLAQSPLEQERYVASQVAPLYLSNFGDQAEEVLKTLEIDESARISYLSRRALSNVRLLDD